MRISDCQLCPRKCGVDRISGQRGYCRAGDIVKIYRFGPHFGEEPPVSGTNGSGTVFFSHCTLGCIYCQNYPCSQEDRGTQYNQGELAEIFRSLREEGCHNWNLVSPTPWLPFIKEVVEELKSDGIALPIVYNTSGFERPEVLLEYKDLADVFLVDLRYSRKDSALEGSGCSEYADIARDTFKDMWKRKGPLVVDANGIAVSGTICRLLILPGRANEVVENLVWLADNAGTDVAISVMAQYTPAFKAQGMEPWSRIVTEEEYNTVCEAVNDLGFGEGWVQDFGGETPRELIGFEMKEIVK